MNELTKEQVEAQGVDYWQSELEYLENAMDGLRTSYSILQSMHHHAKSKYHELLNGKDEE